MLAKKRIVSIAKDLAKFSFDESSGKIAISHVKAAIRAISEFTERERGMLLKRYLYFLENESWRRTLVVEYFGECDLDQLKANLEQSNGSILHLKAMENPGLIAGMRISVGDRLWERSVRNDLSIFSR